MEAYGREIVLRHLEHIVGIGKKHIAPLAVYGHELMLALLERLQGGSVIRLYPASLVERQRLPAALRAVLMQKAVLYHLELKLPTVPMSFRPLNWLTNICATPSSISWRMPFSSCFDFIGSVFSIYLNISGEKEGSPRK